MKMMRSTEQTRREHARRNREYRERQKLRLAALEAQKHEDLVLEDSIKLSAGFGDQMAREIIERAPGLNAPALAAFFQSRAALHQIALRGARRKKKNTPAGKGAGVFL